MYKPRPKDELITAVKNLHQLLVKIKTEAENKTICTKLSKVGIQKTREHIAFNLGQLQIHNKKTELKRGQLWLGYYDDDYVNASIVEIKDDMVVMLMPQTGLDEQEMFISKFKEIFFQKLADDVDKDFFNIETDFDIQQNVSMLYPKPSDSDRGRVKAFCK